MAEPALVAIEPIAALSFQPFGAVIEAPEVPGRSEPFPATGPAAEGLSPTITTSHAEPSRLPVLIDRLERHPQTSQSFVPLDAERWLSIVAPAESDGTPDVSGLRAFVVPGDRGVTIAAGTWHAGLTVLDRPGRFAVMMWRHAERARDTEWATVTPTLVTGEASP